MPQFSLFDSPLELAHQYWQKLLQKSDHVIDATCGNGFDSFKVLSMIPEGFLYGIDIQMTACQNTEAKLSAQFKNFEIYCQSHECFPTCIKPQSVKLIIYNLGYLPKGDKSLTTLKSTTLKSLQEALNYLTPGGALSVMCYSGHEEGFQEQEHVLNWATQLNKTEYLVTIHKILNRDKAPALCLIQKQLMH